MLLRPGPQRLRLLRQLGPEGCERLLHDWRFWGRVEQQWYPEKRFTVVTAGRGWGKTRFASEQVHLMAGERIELCGGEIGIAGRTHADVMRDLIGGPSGILKTQKPWNPCTIEKGIVRWKSGAVGHLLTGDKPAKFRGPNFGFLWGDEFAHWKYPQACYEAFDFSVRGGTRPSIIITSTPLPHDTFIAIATDPDTLRIRGKTLDNRMNLDAGTLNKWLYKYEGTDLGLQELEGEILDGSKHANWKQGDFGRIEVHECPGLLRTVVAIDPAGSRHKKSDLTGITVVAIDDDDNDYVLHSESMKAAPEDWAARAIYLARHHGADKILGERNYGGDMVLAVIRLHPDWPAASYEGIALDDVVAVDSKGNRAVPCAQHYKHGRAFHVGDPRNFAVLEHECTHFDPTLPRSRQSSPNEMDARVHAFAGLHPDREGLGGSSEWTSTATDEFEKMLRSIQ